MKRNVISILSGLPLMVQKVREMKLQWEMRKSTVCFMLLHFKQHKAEEFLSDKKSTLSFTLHNNRNHFITHRNSN